MADLLAPCPSCGHYRDTPNHHYGCAVTPSRTDRQPPASSSETKGGKGLEGPADA